MVRIHPCALLTKVLKRITLKEPKFGSLTKRSDVMKIGIVLVLLMIIGGALIGGYFVVTTGFVATTGKSFGPLVALVGLGAVAFLCVRKS